MNALLESIFGIRPMKEPWRVPSKRNRWQATPARKFSHDGHRLPKDAGGNTVLLRIFTRRKDTTPPEPTRKTVRSSDGKSYRLYTDGSIRLMKAGPRKIIAI